MWHNLGIFFTISIFNKNKKYEKAFFVDFISGFYDFVSGM